MPTNKNRILILLTPDEHESFRREAAENDKSLNNLLRGKLGLPELERGATIHKNRKKPNDGKNEKAI